MGHGAGPEKRLFPRRPVSEDLSTRCQVFKKREMRILRFYESTRETYAEASGCVWIERAGFLPTGSGALSCMEKPSGRSFVSDDSKPPLAAWHQVYGSMGARFVAEAALFPQARYLGFVSDLSFLLKPLPAIRLKALNNKKLWKHGRTLANKTWCRWKFSPIFRA